MQKAPGSLSEILGNENISQNYYALSFKVNLLPIPKPGQFYQIRCSDSNDPLLRRPFSFHRLVQNGTTHHLEILYRVIGKGTEWLSKKKKGEVLDLLGPFGNGFVNEEGMEPLVLVARGIGIAPLYGFAEEALRKDKRRKILILIGARLKERILYEKECRKLGRVFTYTDDGSQGFHGRAPELLCHLLKNGKLADKFSLYACGPAAMLKELAEITKRLNIPGQVALQDHFGCGFGACLSCACPLKPDSIKRDPSWQKPALQWSEDRSRAYSLICKDGPVFDLQEIDWEEWLA